MSRRRSWTDMIIVFIVVKMPMAIAMPAMRIIVWRTVARMPTSVSNTSLGGTAWTPIMCPSADRVSETRLTSDVRTKTADSLP